MIKLERILLIIITIILLLQFAYIQNVKREIQKDISTVLIELVHFTHGIK